MNCEELTKIAKIEIKMEGKIIIKNVQNFQQYFWPICAMCAVATCILLN